MSGNKFNEVLDTIRFEAQESKDVVKTVHEHCGDLLDSILLHPLDCGIKRIRGAAFNAPKPQIPGGNGEKPDWLLVVKGTTESGQDVVSFTHGDKPVSALLSFAYAVELGQVIWKEDNAQSGKRVTANDAYASLAGNSRG